MNVIAETALPEGKKKVDFATTPLMSTYARYPLPLLPQNANKIKLIAFVVGNLEYRELTTFRVPIRVYTPIGFIEDSQFSLDLAVKTLKFYEDAFDCPFPLPKMDMVG
jgi:aminopeptidase 2